MAEDMFTVKKVYECPKCKKTFHTKDEAKKHYDVVHTDVSQYYDATFISKDGKSIGVCKKYDFEDQFKDYLYFYTISITSSMLPRLARYIRTDFFDTRSFSPGYTSGRSVCTLAEIQENFTCVPKDVALKHLESLIFDAVFNDVKNFGGHFANVVLSTIKENDYKCGSTAQSETKNSKEES